MKCFRLCLPAFALAAALLAAGCARNATDSHAGHDHAAGDSAHALAGASGAGSSNAAHSSEGMCNEHGVLEAMCTKCNAGLIPAYQAKGDWCAEHELPESVCPICHPERGGRPVDEADLPDGAPADRTVLTFRSLDSARDAGLLVVAAETGRDPAGVIATATIVADASHRALVHAPAAGVVRAVVADVGTHVAAGAPLARIESATVAESRALLRAASARYAASRAAFVRESTLQRNDLVSAQDVLAARQELESARAAVEGARASLEMFGDVRPAGASGASSNIGMYAIRSPIAGVVTQRVTDIGAMVDTDAMLFEVVDPHALMADLDVPESQAALVRVGQEVTLRVRGAAREARGVVAFLAPAVDTHTRTLRVRVRLTETEGAALRPNAWAEAVIRTATAARTVLVPRAAIQEARGVKLAFVRLADDRYEVRRVDLGGGGNDGAQGLVAVHAGLNGGDMVVTTGSFLLKTETLKESIGAGCCDVEAPKRR